MPLKKPISDHNFKDGDSVIASTINHPLTGLSKLGEWIQKNVTTAAGTPITQDEASMYAYSPDNESKAQAALDLAGIMQVGGSPFAPKSSGGVLGTFIGNKSRTWNQEAADQAQALLDVGFPADKVWKHTGTMRMPDGNLVQELSDHTLKLDGRNLQGKGLLLGDSSIYHPELQAAYPDLADLKVFGRMSNDSGGGYSKASDAIMFNLQPAQAWKGRSTAIHELQHSIQRRENFNAGGSPKNFPDLPPKEAWKKYRSLHGEAQARESEARMFLNDAQRREIYPLHDGKLGGIPVDELHSTIGVPDNSYSLPSDYFKKIHRPNSKYDMYPTYNTGNDPEIPPMKVSYPAPEPKKKDEGLAKLKEMAAKAGFENGSLFRKIHRP